MKRVKGSLGCHFQGNGVIGVGEKASVRGYRNYKQQNSTHYQHINKNSDHDSRRVKKEFFYEKKYCIPLEHNI